MNVRLSVDLSTPILQAGRTLHPGMQETNERIRFTDAIFDALRPVLCCNEDEMWLDVDTDTGSIHVVTQRRDEDGLVHFNRVEVWNGQRQAR